MMQAARDRWSTGATKTGGAPRGHDKPGFKSKRQKDLHRRDQEQTYRKGKSTLGISIKLEIFEQGLKRIFNLEMCIL